MAKTDAETHRLLWRASSLNDVLFTLGRGELVPCAQVIRTKLVESKNFKLIFRRT